MVALPDIDLLERRYTDGGEPILGEAWGVLKQRWDEGARDRETALRLLFLAWYSCSEPPFLTGLLGDNDYASLFRDVYHSFGGAGNADPEFLFVAGYMASLFAWCVGPEKEWQERGEQCLTRWRELCPGGLAPAVFEGHGAYGHYFAHITRLRWGLA